MNKLATAALLFASMGLMAVPALADTFTVDFTGVGGQSTAGVYVYPYNFTVTNNTTSVSENVAMMCIDFEREIFIPETWQANLVNITSSPLPSDALSSSDLDALAVLDSEIVTATPGSAALSDLQFAAWSLTASAADKTTGPYASGFTAGAAADLAAAELAVTAGTSAGTGSVVYADYSYFDPIAGSWPAGDGDPQRFLIDTAGTPFVPHLVPTPEPSSLALLGTGVIGVAGMFRRRFTR